MKVFLSWSGDQSHKVATVFRDWLPIVIQSIEPYVSSEDIDKGARWSTDVASELEDSNFGILCVTRDNYKAPWLIFEAGALSKAMDTSRVCPFLFDLKSSEIDGPILQFQYTVYKKEDLFKLVKSLNKACGDSCLSDERLEKVFSGLFPSLEAELNAVLTEYQSEHPPEAETPNGSGVEENLSNEILEEVLELARDNQKLLRNTEITSLKKIESMFGNIQKDINRIDTRVSSKEANLSISKNDTAVCYIYQALVNMKKNAADVIDEIDKIADFGEASEIKIKQIFVEIQGINEVIDTVFPFLETESDLFFKVQLPSFLSKYHERTPKPSRSQELIGKIQRLQKMDE
jgi:hypothetical protein